MITTFKKIMNILSKVSNRLNYFAGAIILSANSTWDTGGFVDMGQQSDISGPTTIVPVSNTSVLWGGSQSSSAPITDFRSFIARLLSIIEVLVPFLLALALLYFIWGVFKLVFAEAEDKRKEAVGTITYGIIGLAVMVSVWGLVKIMTSTFFGGSLFIPQLN